jgi:hypothetical protein
MMKAKWLPRTLATPKMQIYYCYNTTLIFITTLHNFITAMTFDNIIDFKILYTPICYQTLHYSPHYSLIRFAPPRDAIAARSQSRHNTPKFSNAAATTRRHSILMIAVIRRILLYYSR